MKFTNFTGINNVQPSERLGESDLAQAVNVDVGLSGEVARRQGFTTLDATLPVGWLHERKDCTLVVSGSDLIAVSLNGLTKITLLADASLATSRTWSREHRARMRWPQPKADQMPLRSQQQVARSRLT